MLPSFFTYLVVNTLYRNPPLWTSNLQRHFSNNGKLNSLIFQLPKPPSSFSAHKGHDKPQYLICSYKTIYKFFIKDVLMPKVEVELTS